MQNIICFNNQQCQKLTLALLFLALFGSCSHYNGAPLSEEMPVGEESNVISGPCSKVKIMPRMIAGESLAYPIHVFAFTESGDLQTSQILESSGDALSLDLPTGYTFKLVAVGGNADVYSIPSTPKYSDVISLNASVQIAQGHPLQMAFADITPMNNESRVDMGMNYQQAALDIALSNLPAECSAVKVAISNATPTIHFNGTPGEAQTATFNLTKDTEGVWKTEAQLYVIPSNAPHTTFTITCSFADGDHITSATYQKQLLPGTPYNIYGRYDKGSVDVTGCITSPSWGDPVTLSFDFGTSGTAIITEDGDVNNDDSQDEITNEGDAGDEEDLASLTSLPALGTMYDGHFVAGITNDESESVPSSTTTPGVYNLLIMSLEDWDNMSSANNQTVPTTAIDIAREYKEGDLGGWRIPNDVEAGLLFDYYNISNSAAKKALSDAGASPVILQTGSGSNLSNVKYLCSDAKRTFTFVNGSFVDDRGTLTNLRLRLVNTIRVRL